MYKTPYSYYSAEHIRLKEIKLKTQKVPELLLAPVLSSFKLFAFHFDIIDHLQKTINIF